MASSPQAGKVVSYSFEIDDDAWEDWKDTVPRSKPLDERIIELILADTDGKADTSGISVDLADHRTAAEEEETDDE